MTRRRKSKKGSLSGFAALVAIGLLFNGGDTDQALEAAPSPTPRVTISATATPKATRTPIFTPLPTATPTKRPDPTPAPDDLVWVSRSGSRYHCVADCSNMIEPLVMTETEAIAKGRTPCGSCYK